MGRKIKILITGASVWGNKGAIAMLLSLQYNLKKELGGRQLEFNLLASRYNIDKEVYQKHGISKLYKKERVSRNLKDFFIYKYLKKRSVVDKNRFFQAVLENDIVVDCAGISFYDYSSTFDKCLYQNVNWWVHIKIPKLLNRRVIKFTQSFGVNKNFLTKLVAKSALKSADVIIPRDERSKKYIIKDLGINKDCHVCADIVFKLPSIKDEDIISLIRQKMDVNFEKNRKIMGLCFNSKAQLKDKNYKKKCIDLVLWLKKNFKDHSIFIVVNTDSIKGASSDHDFSLDVLSKLDSLNNIYYFDFEMRPEEIMGVISFCDIFIGARYHSLVFSLSKEVPSISIGWSHKYTELFNLFDLDDFAKDSDKVAFDDLRGMILEIDKNKSKYRDLISSRLEEVQRSAMKAIYILIEQINKI